MPPPTAPIHDPTLLKKLPDRTRFLGASAEKHADASRDVVFDDFSQDLSPRAVETGDAVDVEDDVGVVFWIADAREGRVGGCGAVQFKSS